MNYKLPFTLLFLLLAITFNLQAQDFTGKWNGLLKVPGLQLRLVFNVTKTEGGYTATMDSPDQGAKGIPVTKTTVTNSAIKFEVTNAQIEYNGEMKGAEIIGTFKQAGQQFPMNLSRNEIEKQVLKRPQEPLKPFSYYTEEVSFKNPAGDITLSGTLSMPKKEGSFPVVVMITGSGPQNRDEELFGHKSFLVIADYLAKNGIAVLRYDDRGVGQSTGDFKTATTADFASDVESAIAYLKTRKEINKKKIGLMGHSEGGVIAPIVASRSKDISFIVLLAGTGVSGKDVLLLQQKLIAEASGVSEKDLTESVKTQAKIFDLVVKSKDNTQLKTDLTAVLSDAIKDTPAAEMPGGMTKDEYVAMQVKQVTSPWMQYFVKFDPATALAKVKCPVLAVNGEKDLQVAPTENLNAIKNILTANGNKNVTTMLFPHLNHLFQTAKTGLPDEYGEIEETFSPTALNDITNWIKKQVF